MRRLTYWFATLLFAATAHAQLTTAAQQRAVAEKFGAEIAQAFNQRDRKALAKLIDFQGLVVAAVDFQGLGGNEREAYLRGAGKTGMAPLVDNYFRVLDASHGTVKFIRATNTFPSRSLVRFDMGEQGFNYLEYHLTTDATGTTRTKDWFQLATGDLMSVTLAGVTQLFTSGNPSFVERLLGAKSDTSTMEKLRKLGELQRAGKYPEALEVYKQLPEPVANSRLLLTLRASTASFAKQPAEHDRALATLAKLYGNDPAASFMLIDYYYARRDTQQLLKVIDTVEKRVGVDGNTSLLRANAYSLANDLPNALKYAEEAIRLEPEMLVAHDTRATALVRLARYQEAVESYRGMEQRFGFQLKRANFSDPVYHQFVASKPFRAWLPD